MRFNFTPTLHQTDAHMLSSGKRLHPAVADLNADGYPDVIVGNMSGGLHYYQGKAFNSISVEEEVLNIETSILPNPSTGTVLFEASEASEVALYDLLGKKAGTYEVGTLHLLNLPKGLYVVHFKDDKGNILATKKLVLQ